MSTMSTLKNAYEHWLGYINGHANRYVDQCLLSFQHLNIHTIKR